MKNHITLARRNFNSKVLALFLGGASMSLIPQNLIACDDLNENTRKNDECNNAAPTKEELEEIQKKLVPEILGILKETETRMKESSEKSLKKFSLYFDDAKTKVPEFTDWALGGWSKTYYLVDTITFGTTKWNEELIRKKFESIVMSENSINVEIEKFRKDYMDGMEEALNGMWLKIETTLQNYPSVLEIQKADIRNVKSKINEIIFEAQKGAQTQAAISGPLFLLSCVLEEGLKSLFKTLWSQISIRAGASALSRGTTSTGILGVGAAGSGASLGLSLVGALVIDYILGCFLDSYFDPKGNLTTAIRKKIDEMNDTIMNGDGNQQGIRQLMNKTIMENMKEHGRALQGMIQGNAV